MRKVLPRPDEGEEQQDFLSRCIGSEEMNEEFPDDEQRIAVCQMLFGEEDDADDDDDDDGDSDHDSGHEDDDEEDDKTSRRRHRKIVAFSLKEFDSDRGTFSGYGSTFGNVDSGNDRVIEGAFKNTLESFRAKGQLPAMFWAHDWTQPVGEWLDMNEDSKGLQVKGALWVDGNSLGRTPIEKAEQVRNLLTSNGPKGLSIGYDVQKSSFTTEGDKKRMVRNLERVKLFEVSPVPFGMNAEATVTAAKALTFVGALPTKKRELEMHLRDAGLSRRDAKRLISGGWSALVRDDEVGLAKALRKLKNTIRGG